MNFLSGVGLALTVAGLLKRSSSRPGLRGLALAKTGTYRGERRVEINSIDDRVGLIVEQIREDSADPEIRAAAVAAVTHVCGGEWCVPERDHLGEVKAVFKAMRDPRSPVGTRYTLDRYPAKISKNGPIVGDQFSSAKATLRARGEDCDGQVILLGSLLMSIGYPVKCRIVQTQGFSSWNHIYLLVGIPPDNPEWIALDPTEPHAPGWQVSGADQVARTGRPSGEVTAVKDYEV